ncbi:hypothetical protein BLNAU_17907 [Blattamonas nauphoetae]|uniref:Uncharacterized protein n=1 Tax=Blattamonas nauphoetae TaxID=2049346 RepID=A0ABQ9X5T9_9EUKA|nr:hypothetical protein BLNAU_17907 [Blattamonas nauphoetae]
MGTLLCFGLGRSVKGRLNQTACGRMKRIRQRDFRDEEPRTQSVGWERSGSISVEPAEYILHQMPRNTVDWGRVCQFISSSLSSLIVVALFRSGITLFIRADLNTGTTTACPTFASPPLTAHTLSNCLLSRQKEQERETEQQLKLD